MIDESCAMGDHLWGGTSACKRGHCCARLRCACGCYIREENIHAHIQKCSYYEREMRKEHEDIMRGWA